MVSSARSIVAAAQFALLGGLLLVGGIVVGRRLAGGLMIPLSTVQLVVAGLAVAALALGIRLIWTRLLSAHTPVWHDYATRFAPPAACVLIAMGILLPATPLAGACLLVMLLAVEETWSLARLPGGLPWMRGVGGSSRELTLHEPGFDESLDQQFTRRRAGGEEVVAGRVRVRFAAGQRTAEAHVAFCPPFDRRPQVTFEPIAGPPARIELGQVLPLGARLDIKLAQPAMKDLSLVIGLTARASAEVAA